MVTFLRDWCVDCLSSLSQLIASGSQPAITVLNKSLCVSFGLCRTTRPDSRRSSDLVGELEDLVAELDGYETTLARFERLDAGPETRRGFAAEGERIKAAFGATPRPAAQ